MDARVPLRAGHFDGDALVAIGVRADERLSAEAGYAVAAASANLSFLELSAPEFLPSAPDLDGTAGSVAELGGSSLTLGAIAIAAIAAAYWYSLRSLVVSFSLTRPRSFEVVVPILAAALAACYIATQEEERLIHDRQVDCVIGASAIVAGLFMLAMLPSRMGIAFWVQRLDLLSLPLFAAGAIALLFGTRRLWQVRGAVLLLVLAWPPIVRVVVDRATGPVGKATTAVIRGVTGATGIASVAPGSTRFFVGGATLDLGGASKALSIVVLVAIAALTLALARIGSFRRKAAWLALSVALAGFANLLRLLLAVVTLWVFDQRAASWVVGAPGIVVATGAVLTVSIALAPTFGLTRRSRSAERSALGRQPGIGVVAVTVAALLAAALTGQMATFAGVTYASGEPRATTLLDLPPRVVGFEWASRPLRISPPSTPIAHQYTLRRVTLGTSAAHPTGVLVDVLGLNDTGNGSEADLRARFPLVRRRVLQKATVGLGHGVTADRLSFGGLGATWTVLTWLLPVRDDAGAPYERVVVAGTEARSLTQQAIRSPAPSRATTDGTIGLGPFARAVVESEFGSRRS